MGDLGGLLTTVIDEHELESEPSLLNPSICKSRDCGERARCIVLAFFSNRDRVFLIS